MFFQKSTLKRFLSALAIASTLAAGIPLATTAQSLPGFTIFGGPDREFELDYYLESGNKNDKDRYKLRIPARKMEVAASRFVIQHPDYYDGTFPVDEDGNFLPEEVEIRVGRGRNKETIAVGQAIWIQESYTIEIYPQQPVPADTAVEIVFHDVKNPRFGGMFFFQCFMEAVGDPPGVPPRYVGTWVIGIN
ncbi:MAG: DUF2808 domain-containing protein [Synechococcaceae cyanobacterium SM2_3_1]|nr:DUF2808 domain-containing protein [Synechococcaceae cyanobacterium SM2_3_1]